MEAYSAAVERKMQLMQEELIACQVVAVLEQAGMPLLKSEIMDHMVRENSFPKQEDMFLGTILWRRKDLFLKGEDKRYSLREA